MPRRRSATPPAPHSGPRFRVPRLLEIARRLWSQPAGRFLVRYPFVTALVFLLPPLFPAMEPWLIQWTLYSLALARFLTADPVQVAGTTFTIGPTVIQI